MISQENESESVPFLKAAATAIPHEEVSFRRPFYPKLIYFTLNMALYSSLTFTSAYFFERWGLPIYQFGALSSLSIIELFGAIWWGGLADRTGKHRKILLMCTFLYCLLFCLLPVAEWALPEDGVVGVKLAISTVLLGGTYFFMSSFFPLIDSCVLRELKRRAETSPSSSFGKQRLWGTVGHAIVTLITAQFISWYGWVGMFVVMILTCLLFATVVYCTITDESVRFISRNEFDIGENSETWSFLWRFDFVLFLLVVLLAGYMRSILSIFLPYHLLIDLHQTPLFVGLTAVFRISAEILIFAYAQISSPSNRNGLNTRGNEVKLVLFGLLAGVLRVAGYAELEFLMKVTGSPPLWLIVFVLESLKGISVACLISGAVRLAHDLVPDNVSTRAQALVSGTYSGLSTGLAGVFGGGLVYLLPSRDLRDMFRITALLGIIGVLFSLKLMNLIK